MFTRVVVAVFFALLATSNASADDDGKTTDKDYWNALYDHGRYLPACNYFYRETGDEGRAVIAFNHMTAFSGYNNAVRITRAVADTSSSLMVGASVSDAQWERYKANMEELCRPILKRLAGFVP